MSVDADALELRLIRRAEGVDLNLLPLQGLWTEEQYLALTNQTNHLIELTDGVIEVQGDHRERIVAHLRAAGHQVKLAGG